MLKKNLENMIILLFYVYSKKKKLNYTAMIIITNNHLYLLTDYKVISQFYKRTNLH